MRDLWEKKDLGKFSERFTAQVTTRRLRTIFLAGLRFQSHTEPVDPSCPLLRSHSLGHISPISSPFFLVFCAFSPSRRGGSNEPQAGTQGQETAGKAPRGVFDSGPQRL